MKKLLFIIITMAVCLTISGQQINQSDNRYRSYDVLEKKQVSVKCFDMNGSENRPLTHLSPSSGLHSVLGSSSLVIHCFPISDVDRTNCYYENQALQSDEDVQMAESCRFFHL